MDGAERGETKPASAGLCYIAARQPMDTAARKKLAWRCRRGTRELDRMTQYYLERHYDEADPAHRRAFEALLELPDPQLHDILTGRAAGGDPSVDNIARLIRDHCEH